MPHPGVRLLREQFIAHRRPLRDSALRVLGCRQQAEDVLQDTFLKLGALPPSLEVQQPLAFLSRMVRNLAIDRYRRSALESSVFCGDDVEHEPWRTAETPEAILMGRQSLSAVIDALATLPERTRHAFELHRLEEQTQRQIATRLAVSPTLVNFMIRDATSRCRAALEGSAPS